MSSKHERSFQKKLDPFTQKLELHGVALEMLEGHHICTNSLPFYFTTWDFNFTYGGMCVHMKSSMHSPDALSVASSAITLWRPLPISSLGWEDWVCLVSPTVSDRRDC